MFTFDGENLLLAVGATLRLAGRPGTKEERRFFQILSGFLWTYAICAGLYNSQVLPLQEQMGLYDLLVVIPFLFLAVPALIPSACEPETAQAPVSRPVSLFIDTASPILFTLALLALGLVNIRRHFYSGVLAIAAALVVYAIRTTVLQNRYIRSQRALQEARDRLEEMSLRDGLTGVANRRCFDQILEMEWNRAVRTQDPLTLLLIDVDYFKNLNDRYGHRSGDQCLVEVAAALREMLPRGGDLLARYGGEEFAAILVSTNRAGAEMVAARMREAVRALNIRNETSIGHFATVSIGIATWQVPTSDSPASLVEASDRALYRAKQNGRNREEYFSMQALFEASPM